MTGNSGYRAVMARRAEIVKRSVGLDYAAYATGTLGFDYERLLADTGYSIEETRRWLSSATSRPWCAPQHRPARAHAFS